MASINYLPQTTGVNPAMTPANASGGQFSGAEGAAIEHLGQEGGREASDLNRIQHIQTVADDKVTLDNNMADGFRKFTEFGENLKGQVGVNGAGYTEQMMKAYDDWSSKATEGMRTPQTRALAAAQVKTLGNHFMQRSMEWEAQARSDWRSEGIQQSTATNAATLANDPSLYPTLLKNSLEDLHSSMGDLHSPQKMMALENHIRSSYSQAASEAYARQNPQNTVNLLTGAQPLREGTIPAQISAAADKYGVPRETMLVNAQLESNMGTAANSGNKGGIFQFMPQTAKQYGIDPSDPVQNIDGGAQLTRDNIKALTKSLGKAPDIYQSRMAHWFGAGGAASLIKAPDNATVADTVGLHGDDLRKNGLTEQTTVGQLKANIGTAVDSARAKIAGYAAAPTPGDKPDISAMPDFMRDYIGRHPGAYDSMLSHAQTILNKGDVAAKVAMEGQISNFNAAVLRGENAERPSDQQIIATMGYRAPAIIAELNTNQRYGAAYGQLKSLPLQQMQATIDAWKPTDTSTALERQRYDDLNTQAARINLQRRNQPLETAAATGVYDLKPIDFSDMTKVGGQLSYRNAVAAKVSQDYGTPFTNLTDDEAKAISGFVKGAPTAQVAQLFQQIRSGSSDSSQYLATLAKIAPEHQVPAVAGAIMLKQNPIDLGATHWYGDSKELQSQGDVASTMLDGWRAMNPGKDKDGAQVAPPKLDLPKDTNFAQEFQKVVGSTFGTDTASYNAAFEAAKAHYVGSALKSGTMGSDWTNTTAAAFDKSIKAATGGIVNYAGRGNIALPWGMSETAFNDAMSKEIPAAVAAVGGDPAKFSPSAQALVSIGDGKYRLVNGTSPVVVNGKLVDIDLNKSQPVPPRSAELTVSQVNRGVRTLAPNLDRKAR